MRVGRSLWLGLAAATYSVSALATEPLWSGDFETGDLSQWPSSESQPGAADRLVAVNEPVRQGQHALRATVKHGDFYSSGARAEVVLANPMFREGDERWFHWYTLFPADFQASPSWIVYTQWHSNGFDVPLAFNLRGETLSFRVMGHQYDRAGLWDAGTLWKAPLQRGKWNEYLLHVKFSDKSNIGFVELWVDGDLVVPKTMHATLVPRDSVYLKMGLYRDQAITWAQTVYHDGMAVYAGDPRPRESKVATTHTEDVLMADVAQNGETAGCGSNRGASAALLLPGPLLVGWWRRTFRRRRQTGAD